MHIIAYAHTNTYKCRGCNSFEGHRERGVRSNVNGLHVLLSVLTPGLLNPPSIDETAKIA